MDSQLYLLQPSNLVLCLRWLSVLTPELYCTRFGILLPEKFELLASFDCVLLVSTRGSHLDGARCIPGNADARYLGAFPEKLRLAVVIVCETPSQAADCE